MSWKTVIIVGAVLGASLGGGAYVFLNHVDGQLRSDMSASSCGLDNQTACDELKATATLNEPTAPVVPSVEPVTSPAPVVEQPVVTPTVVQPSVQPSAQPTPSAPQPRKLDIQFVNTTNGCQTTKDSCSN